VEWGIEVQKFFEKISRPKSQDGVGSSKVLPSYFLKTISRMMRNSVSNLAKSTSFRVSTKPTQFRSIPISRLLPIATSSSSPATTTSFHRCYATSTTPNSSTQDPSEVEALKLLEKGTQHLEAGEVEKAKQAYERSLDIKQTSSAAFNLGVTKYHESEYVLAD